MVPGDKGEETIGRNVISVTKRGVRLSLPYVLYAPYRKNFPTAIREQDILTGKRRYYVPKYRNVSLQKL